MAGEKLRFDTLKVRGGYDPKENNFSVSVPIYQSAAFDLGNTERASKLFSFSEFGFIYTRVGNPTVAVLERRVAELDDAAGAVALGSGMAALTYTLFNLAEGGGRILTTPRLYGGTFDSFKKIYPKFGIEIDYAEDPDDPASFENAIKDDTKAIFVETISNPNGAIADIEALSEIAHNHNIPLVVDNTFATPYLLNPFKFGTDIIVYSATKALNGHGNVIAGLVLESGKFNWANGKFPQFTEPQYTLRDFNGKERSILDVFPQFPFTARIRNNYLAYFGAALGPFDAYLTLIGLETLSERIRKQVSSTEKLIQYLEGKKEVAWIKYPLAKGSPYKLLAEKYLPKGAGSVFTFGFNGTDDQLNKFLDSVKIFSFHANVGDARSLIINSPKTTHGELTKEEQNRAGITSDTIRISVGLEDPDDLIEDLEQAFNKAFD
ncbi:O-acetylhomoserine aminocarboxypropyltransferase/cysteine synthase family protein [Thermoanaerobacterium thermosaccharolyticum]|uniref:O-acetylhomoserine aminocarboxypropyltransferase/cysteine synthase family protein n=1 Tax=Thermoanaerobacterium thermosaccharolyticum TaxID=1517 RepID=UPI0002FD9039|nr:aminotransferase class I/II-fold pyridoxal phosphate-dependent enzyme [Thermoanaerobacterium thermosaccharolyticum]